MALLAHSRATRVQSLVEEYIACESPNYIEWGMQQRGQGLG